jgi:hypothetical protein
VKAPTLKKPNSSEPNSHKAHPWRHLIYEESPVLLQHRISEPL